MRDELFNYYQAASSKVKQYVRNITPLEQKVMDATSNEKWGPHGTAMAGKHHEETRNAIRRESLLFHLVERA